MQSSYPLTATTVPEKQKSERQGVPEAPHYHPSPAWHNLACLLHHQSPVSTFKPHLYLYSFNQGNWNDVALTARQTEQQRDDNKNH